MADQSSPAAVLYSTLNEYLKKVSDFTSRDYVVINRVQRAGKVSYNHEGLQCDWPIQVDLPEVQVYTGGALDFPESDNIRNFVLPWRGNYTTDSMTELAKLMNRGDAARVRVVDTKADNMRTAMQNHLAKGFYLDGYTNTGECHGLESIFGYTACAAADRLAAPDDDYAGTTTDLATYNGTWDTAGSSPPNSTLGYEWPNGNGDVSYDATSPKLVNIVGTDWSSGKATVADNIEEAISQTITWCTLLGGRANAPNLVLLSPDWYETYKNVQRSKQTINVPHTEQQDVGFNFKGFYQDGAFITTEFGMPASRGYVLGPNSVELRCMYRQLFMAKPPQDDIRMWGTLWLMGFFGNWCLSPKYCGKIADFTS